MELQNLVAQEGKGLEGIEGVQHKKAAQVRVLAHGELGPVERGERIIAQKNAQLGVVIGSALLIEFPKFRQPKPAADSGSHADFQNKNLRGQLLLRIKVAQQGPKITDAIRDGLRLMPIGLAAWQCLLITPAGRLLPILQT